LLALAFSLALALPPAPSLPQPPAESSVLVLLVGGEALIGAFFGIAARAVFAALHVAGSVIAFQSGLAAAAIFDPNEATQGTLSGNLLTTTGLVLLFVTHSHHALLQSIAGSYGGLPAGVPVPLGAMSELLIALIGAAFALAVQIAAPLILVSLLTHLLMGVLNRLMPAFQVLFVALPAQMLLTFAALMLTLAGGLLAFFDLLERSIGALLSGP
jgi:flagellar biosynthetic protein FliR